MGKKRKVGGNESTRIKKERREREVNEKQTGEEARR